MTSTDLQAARAVLSLTQRQLATRLEISVGTVARWEMPANRGRFPVPRWVARELRRLIEEAQRARSS